MSTTTTIRYFKAADHRWGEGKVHEAVFNYHAGWVAACQADRIRHRNDAWEGDLVDGEHEITCTTCARRFLTEYAVRVDYDGHLLCPVCGFNFVHLTGASDSDEPTIFGWCEGGHRFAINFAHYKGQTVVRASYEGAVE